MRRSLLHPNQKICRYYLTSCSSCRIFNHGNTIHTECRSLLSRRGESIEMGPRQQPCRIVCVVRLLSLRPWATSLWRITENSISDVMVIVNTIPVPLMHILITLQLNSALKMSASKGSEGRSNPILYLCSECTTAKDYYPLSQAEILQWVQQSRQANAEDAIPPILPSGYCVE